MAKEKAPAPLLNTSALSRPRSGEIGVLPVDEIEDSQHITKLRIAVSCPFCMSYADICGEGDDYRNVTKMVDPTFCCSGCSWRPTTEEDSPEVWKVFYSGRLGGTLIWSMNEEHIEVLVKYLETNPKRRKRVEFGWEYRHLMQRLPNEAVSGRQRHDMVSLLKKMMKTRPTHLGRSGAR